MRWATTEHTYEGDWETVTSAFWVKYPNPKQPHVKYIDTLHREIDSDAAILRARRLLLLQYDFPAWYRALHLPCHAGHVIEDTTVDLHKKTLTLTSQNITLSNLFRSTEECTYEVHPDNPKWTKYTMVLGVEFTGVGWLNSTLEGSFIDKVKEKFRVGFDVMTERITSLQTQDWKRRRSEWQEELARMAKDFQCDVSA